MERDTDPLASAKTFLVDHVLPFWWDDGRCTLSGSWFEGFGFDSRPLSQRLRRSRVWPRQIFAFGMAHRLGLINRPDMREKLAENTQQLLQRSRLEDGRFAGALDAQGQPTGDPALLYDMAFYALAGAEIAQHGIDAGFELAETAFAEIDARFRDQNHGGYLADARKPEDPKLANPHMHLLEASIAWFDATSKTAGADRISEILSLFRTHFLRQDGHVREACASDYERLEEGWVEPGHGFEWAYLYDQAEQRLGRDGRERALHMVQAANATLIEGLAPNRIRAEPPQFRLWPQLERLRVMLTFFPAQDIRPLVERLDRLYFSQGPDWGWNDEVDLTGRALSEYVPASMVYHLVTALGPLFAKTSAPAQP